MVKILIQCYLLNSLSSNRHLKCSTNYYIVQEDRRKRKVHRLEVYEAAHKKRMADTQPKKWMK
uniref:Uncharacterized protein n=1 Tax=Arundo donax TaxID=35708 RepID=A0A0A9GR94_ARUDO